ncbi:hypothetical protein [Mycobacterium sp. OTB74]|jgi:hypothetical protein|nr:hypothetical protein [Mycobacterium sp. OTB74]MDH6247545.1 hypothetical protein [Mycobacterium sp. OTB74]
MKQHPVHWPTHRRKARQKAQRHRAAVWLENRARTARTPAALRNWSRP